MALRNCLLTLAALSLAGCAGTGGKALDAKVAAETNVTRPSDLREEATRLIQTEPGLSDDQRQRLSALQASTTNHLADIRDHSLRLRSLLMEELLSPGYDVDEVGLIKGRLKNLEKQRLSLLFDGVDKANAIMGRDGSQHEKMMRRIFEMRANDGAEGRE